jgi:16S rRNA (guanine527-N7)-methyltransferase
MMLATLSRESEAYGTRLSEAQMRQFEVYFELLVAWSARANLVGSIDANVVQRRHFLESIALGAALREREILRPDTDVLDVGAGAGFPGAVLNIVWPSIRLTLIEATAKKAAFLEALVEALGFADATVLHGRAETLGHAAALRGRFGLVVARAVAPLPALLELTLPFAKIGGRVATPKGSRGRAEIEAAGTALSVLGAQAFSIRLAVPGPEQTLVVAVKQRETPAEYPRRPGVPAKSPL